MILPKLITANLISKLPTGLCLRTMATGGTASDPIQKLFLDKLKDYNKKASSTPDGLVDATEATRKGLQEEFERVKRNFMVKEGEEGKIVATFSDDTFKLDPINQKHW